MDASRIEGCLFGMAFGDAIGTETEFLNIAGILQQFPPNGPQEPPGNPALVTDDTQMALAVGEALLATEPPYDSKSFGENIKKAFIAWYDDPDNNRAPGVTCLTSIEELMEGTEWIKATNISSKGCGANMRVMPIGLLASDETTRAAMAQFQAAYTHAHPTGLAAADLTAYVIADLAEEGIPAGLVERAREYAESQRQVYHAEWLGDLWRRAFMMRSAEEYIEYGWQECLGVLDKLEAGLQNMDRHGDPCLTTGAGWIAEEALATALFCFLMYPDDPKAVIQRAAVTSGDSDSIACIAGAFAGAHHGIDAWKASWVQRIEYRSRIQALCDGLNVRNKATV